MLETTANTVKFYVFKIDLYRFILIPSMSTSPNWISPFLFPHLMHRVKGAPPFSSSFNLINKKNIFAKSTHHEAPHYIIFSGLVLLPLSRIAKYPSRHMILK